VITDSCERLWMIRPSWAVIEQNVQPPKQPRMICTLVSTTSKAGIRAAPYEGCGRRVKGRP
jgi:hypothetical protein